MTCHASDRPVLQQNYPADCARVALSKIHPNVLTFFGLVINVVAAVLLARGAFFWPRG